MNRRTVKQIFLREVRDQFRDRRTLFIIAVLPILLYPLLGMSMFQMAQFMQEQPTKVLVIGGEQMLNRDKVEDVTRLFVVEKTPGLLTDSNGSHNGTPPLQDTVAPSPPQKIFSPSLFPGENQKEQTKRAKLLELTFWEDWKGSPQNLDPVQDSGKDPVEYAKKMVNTGKFDAAVYFAPDFAEQLDRFREAYVQHGRSPERESPEGYPATGDQSPTTVQVPQPEIFYTTTNERSGITYRRLMDVLQYTWVNNVGRQNLEEAGLPSNVTRPFQVQGADLAVEEGKSGVAAWAKILPIMLLVWALTGAFYPAIDLCAGEKERGTLETLLCSPAHRSEIVVGKLATVMLFSIMTAVLNIVSIGITGWFLISKVPVMGAAMGSVPWFAIVWLVPTLIPVAALFSAVCVALAAFAKSSKEGQYYLMPVLLIALPLAVLPMTPSVELNLGTSLIPITNICLLLRVLIEGQYLVALKFLLPVFGVTLFCCVLAVRWAVDQFQHESVLFRESERLDLILWLRHVFKDRHPTPTVAAATLAGIMILMIKFFMGAALPMPTNFDGLARMVIITQVAVILTPALLMTVTFTTARAKTLLLGREAWTAKIPLAIVMALLLAVVGHPLVIAFQHFVTSLYPVSVDLSGLDQLFKEAPGFWVILLLFAVLPAVCEEIAFRGFILSGFRHTGSKWRAIALTAILFGMTHSILQQSIVAATVGLVIGYLAVQSGNLLVPIAYHVTHNSLAMSLSLFSKETVRQSDVFGGVAAWDSSIAKGFVYLVNEFAYHFMIWGPNDTLPHYDWRLVVVAGIVFVIVIERFSRFRYTKTEEEKLKQEIARQQYLNGTE